MQTQKLNYALEKMNDSAQLRNKARANSRSGSQDPTAARDGLYGLAERDNWLTSDRSMGRNV